jgi:hypothetical protein
MHKPKRTTGEDGLIVESVVFRPQLLFTRENILLGIGNLGKDSFYHGTCCINWFT